jgi:hypothetical protein
MSKGLFDIILDSIFDANWKGKRGEKLTERELNLVKFFGRDGKVLRNVYVPKANGETSEIDVVFITQKGIFVIESKNYSGWIFGDEKSSYWTVMLPNKTKSRFYNPVKQNRTHIKWLSQYLNNEVPLFSIVAFSERCELKKVTIDSQDIHVIKRDRIYATVRNIWDSTADVIDDNKVDGLYEKLEILTNVDNAVKAAHIESIQERYNKPKSAPVQKKATTEREPQEKASETTEYISEPWPSDSLTCPRCGEKLVLRTARKGPNAGNDFYGCSNFPNCRYTKHIVKTDF